jgi:pteridine reductase
VQPATSDRAGRLRVVVTGASRRVGRAIALRLASEGCDLELVHRERTDEALRTAEDARAAAASAGRAIEVATHAADFDDAHAVERLAAELAERCAAGLAGLVHNASSYAPSRFGSCGAEEFARHLRINAIAPALLTQALAPALVRACGAVVLFSDIHVLGRPRRGYLAYSMSKAAASDLVATLAVELAPAVRVNGIAPGVVAWPDDAPASERQAYEARIPLGRSGTPEEAAEATRWLLLDAAYVTGEILRLDGGRWLR